MTIAARLRHCRNALVLLACAAVYGCAAAPDDAPIVEQLDRETGMTVARLGRPIELYRETSLQDAAVRFAFLAPFETNRMGTRDLFLWVAVPVEFVAGAETPVVALNGAPIALGTPARTADFAGLRATPYRLPTPWSTTWYFKVDADTVARLGESSRLAVRVPEVARNGTTTTAEFIVDLDNETRLREFAHR
jgi:hypothetical protein